MNRLELISELLLREDVEGLISMGAPVDEYKSEARMISDRLAEAEQKTWRLTREQVLSIVQGVWREMFDLSDEQLTQRRDAFEQITSHLAAL
jgi:hypothetical protein